MLGLNKSHHDCSKNTVCVVNTCINGKYLEQNKVLHCQRYGTTNRSINNKTITSITANVTNSLSSLAMCGL
jgi:hypothetical protein